MIERRPSRVLDLDDVIGTGVKLFQAALDLDLEGIVGNRVKTADVRRSTWIKDKNPGYSQKEGGAGTCLSSR